MIQLVVISDAAAAKDTFLIQRCIHILSKSTMAWHLLEQTQASSLQEEVVEDQERPSLDNLGKSIRSFQVGTNMNKM
jgi:hypothetical protein